MNTQATIVITSIFRNARNAKKIGAAKQLNLQYSTNVASPLKTYEEVQFPVPWGQVSGKWWGRKDVTPVIALHGFEDNAGSYDRLAPLLNLPSFLALDLPGHGRSSHIPCGMVYHFIDFVSVLRRIIIQSGWQQFSIVGHSFGSAMGHIYASLYPSEVAKFVSLDCTRTFMALLGTRGFVGLDQLRKATQTSLKADRNISKEPPAYLPEDMVEAFCKATRNSVLKKNAQPLMDRGASAHPSQPGHFYFSRDPKLRLGDFLRPNLEILDEAAQNIKCHVITILGTRGFVKIGADSTCGTTFYQLEGLVEKSAASYQRFDIEGTHHVHLNNPEKVAPLINDFLGK